MGRQAALATSELQRGGSVFRFAALTNIIAPLAVMLGVLLSGPVGSWALFPAAVLALLLLAASRKAMDRFTEAEQHEGGAVNPARRFRRYVLFCAEHAGWARPAVAWWITLAAWLPLLALLGFAFVYAVWDLARSAG